LSKYKSAITPSLSQTSPTTETTPHQCCERFAAPPLRVLQLNIFLRSPGSQFQTNSTASPKPSETKDNTSKKSNGKTSPDNEPPRGNTLACLVINKANILQFR